MLWIHISLLLLSLLFYILGCRCLSKAKKLQDSDKE